MKRLAAVLLATLVVLSGCATLSEEECLTADWYSIGFEDGSNGYPSSRIGAHREACAKHGVTPDLRQYQDGHEEGLINFCTPRNGFNRARNGYQYSGICPPSLEADFLDGYQAGREIYAVTSEISSLRSEQRSNENEMTTSERRLNEMEAVLFSDALTPEERQATYNEITRLRERQGELKSRNEQLIRDIADAEARLRMLEDRFSYY
ncbi:DUF2799 domain-containing protein [Saccharospirillum mangrovi]|uniref:DUF2799 domain-containing protein n=1 Tax=Saccharospirillum mangrovi TaxID=2161747 RepID=UPI0013005FF3|nr:DUF2799 domain-containing protein [Saccharospirillum mangrovi]